MVSEVTYERRKLPATRNSIAHRAVIGDRKVYIIVGLFEDGSPGELFIKVNNEDDQGWCNSIAILVSIILQADVPLKTICKHLSYQHFDPSGWTQNEDIGYAKSVVDYIGRWLLLMFGEKETEPKEKGT